MKIDEAINSLEQLDVLFTRYLHKDFEGAWKLGIEALKFVKRLRVHDDDFTIITLPGETI